MHIKEEETLDQSFNEDELLDMEEMEKNMKMPQSMQEAGDVLAWLNSSGAERGKIFDLPSLYSQSWPRVDGIQVFKSVGTGLADAACAWLLYQKLKGSWSKSCI